MKLNNVDLNKVAVFCQVVDAGNYRTASEALNVTPSAISQAISSLESALELKLFDRVGKRLIPTDAGAKLHREFGVHHRGFLDSLRNLSESEDLVAGTLHIGAYLEFAKSRLAPVISAFLKANPDAQVKLVFDTPSRLHRLLEAGKLDLCFSIYPSHETRAIESKPVYHEELVLIAPKGMLESSPDYDEVIAQPVVEYYSSHQPIRRWLSLHYKKKPRHLNVRAFATTAEMVLALVREGAGIGIVPEYLLGQRPGEFSRSMRVVRPTTRRFTDHIWMLEPTRTTKSAVHRAFRAMALERFDQ